eukprot:CAMPEP_0196237724 /NCGR_PEP_ID=MMETSP0913-20130531/6653_1 /TAXON_ID=49265 /ORGANISM="Thalassiosira rotula, Strain GSO102" /LENGTH=42 /DNA_ID= /DNA_START= /DNA_END= /DNA_ORIENTATION=
MADGSTDDEPLTPIFMAGFRAIILPVVVFPVLTDSDVLVGVR